MATPSDRREVVLALRAAGCVFAEEEADLLLAQAATETDLAAMLSSRVAGEPLEQVLGWAEFCGHRILLDPGVFVPRRRTELMVREAVRLAAGAPAPVVVDLCCGSGAVGAAMARLLPAVELYATDLDPAAVRCARRNITAPGRVLEGDLFEALPPALRGRVDVVAANTPYVPTAAIRSMPPEARDHEPRMALDGGADGLAVADRVAAQAPSWLVPGGSLLVETGERQADALARTFSRNRLSPRVEVCEEATIVVGTLPG
ncbi:MAG: release factor glutamine methyltransferase [Nocardioidaceae bacterium]|nr:release factor glutamine methyltransferase [Nocardioidaceae bacterium]